MKISLCFIAKNEEKVVERILKLGNKFADEIVFVDTGSNDKTVEIAKKHTKNVYNFNWVNDFSKARNFAFSKAKYEFLMWLDCDDFITEENVEKIIKLKNENANFDTYMFNYKVGNDDKNSITFYRERLIRNTPQAKFQGFIHEAIPPFGRIAYTDIEIEHKKEKQSNPKRNLEIYKYHIKNGENLSSRDTYYLGKEYYYNGYFYTARKILNKYLKMDRKYLPDVRDALLTLYIISTKKLKKSSVKYLLNCINICGFESEILCKIGDEKLSCGEQILAIEYYEMALNCKKDGENKGFLKNEYYYLYPLLQLTYIYYKFGNIEKALYYHNLCLKENEEDNRVAYNQQFFKNYYKNFKK